MEEKLSVGRLIIIPTFRIQKIIKKLHDLIGWYKLILRARSIQCFRRAWALSSGLLGKGLGKQAPSLREWPVVTQVVGSVTYIYWANTSKVCYGGPEWIKSNLPIQSGRLYHGLSSGLFIIMNKIYWDVIKAKDPVFIFICSIIYITYQFFVSWGIN